MNRLAVASLAVFATAAAFAETRVGIIGLDTSHALRFTEVLNVKKPDFAKDFRVTAAYQWGSRDIVSSTNRYPEYLKKFAEMGVAMKPSIAALLAEVDCVLLETNDGRPHYEQALEVFRSGKPVFIDKPVAADLADAVKIVEAGRRLNAKWFCSSTLRFQDAIDEVKSGKYGKLRGVETFSPYKVEPTQSRYFWYAIHGAEPLFALMGTGNHTYGRSLRGDKGDTILTATEALRLSSTWAVGGGEPVMRTNDVSIVRLGTARDEKGVMRVKGAVKWGRPIKGLIFYVDPDQQKSDYDSQTTIVKPAADGSFETALSPASRLPGVLRIWAVREHDSVKVFENRFNK